MYRGDFVQNHVRVPAGAVFRHILDFEPDIFATLRPEAFDGQAFSRHVWRVVFDGPTLLHGVDRMGCVIRPPRADEKPARRWAAYGSSITHGYTPAVLRRRDRAPPRCGRHQPPPLRLVPMRTRRGRVSREPRRLGFYHLRTRREHALAHHEPNVFVIRVLHLLTLLTTRQPGKAVVLISPFTTAADYAVEPEPVSRRTAAYRLMLADPATEFVPRPSERRQRNTDLLCRAILRFRASLHRGARPHGRKSRRAPARPRRRLKNFGPQTIRSHFAALAVGIRS